MEGSESQLSRRTSLGASTALLRPRPRTVAVLDLLLLDLSREVPTCLLAKTRIAQVDQLLMIDTTNLLWLLGGVDRVVLTRAEPARGALLSDYWVMSMTLLSLVGVRLASRIVRLAI